MGLLFVAVATTVAMVVSLANERPRRAETTVFCAMSRLSAKPLETTVIIKVEGTVLDRPGVFLLQRFSP